MTQKSEHVKFGEVAEDYPGQREYFKNGKRRKQPLYVVRCVTCEREILDGSMQCWRTMGRTYCPQCVRKI
jgi:hypothetical protein